MTRGAVLLIAAGLFAGCAAPKDDRPVARAATLTPEQVADSAVNAIAGGNVAALSALIHPRKGVRFTPYTHVDTLADQRFTRDELLTRWARPDSVVWGAFDGSGEPIRLTVRQYVARFVTDFDAAHAPRVVRDSAPVGRGNSINNVRAMYPDATIIEFHQPGADPRYGGMDWRSLWVVLEKFDDAWYVVGFVHGSWTI